MPLEPLGRVQSLRKHLKMTSGWWEWKCSSRGEKSRVQVNIFTLLKWIIWNVIEHLTWRAREWPGLSAHFPLFHFLSLLCHSTSSCNSRNWLCGTRIYSWEWDHSSPCWGAILYLQTFFVFILRMIAERCWISLLSLNTESPVSQDHAVPLLLQQCKHLPEGGREIWSDTRRLSCMGFPQEDKFFSCQIEATRWRLLFLKE